MKNKKNKMQKLCCKKVLSKNDLLLLKKYPRLLIYGADNSNFYYIVNRGYLRYLHNFNKFIDELKVIGYQSNWFPINRNDWSVSIKTAIESEKYEYQYNQFTRGDISLKVYRMSRLLI